MRFSGIVKPISGTTFKSRQVTTGKATVWNCYDVEVVQGKADAASDKAVPLTAALLVQPDTRNDRIFDRFNKYVEQNPDSGMGIKVNCYIEIINKYAFHKPIDADEEDITAVETWKKKLIRDYAVPGSGELLDMILTTGELDIVRVAAFGARQIITSDSSLLGFRAKKGQKGYTLEECNTFLSSQMISFVDMSTIYQDLLAFFDKKSEVGASLSTFHQKIGSEVMGVQWAGKLQKSLYNGESRLAINITDLLPLWFKRKSDGPIDRVEEGAELNNDPTLDEAEDF